MAPPRTAGPTTATRPDATMAAPPVPWCWFSDGAVSVELVCDDPTTLAAVAALFADHLAAPDTARVRRRVHWQLSVRHARSLAVVGPVFAGVALVEVADGISAHHHQHPDLGHTWWIPDPAMILHNPRERPRSVAIRYTDPATAHDWTPRLIGRFLTAQPADASPDTTRQPGRGR